MNPVGRAILKSCHYMEAMEVVDEKYPLQLSNGRITRHFHTRTKTGRTPELQSRDEEPWLQISHEDAKAHQLSNGDLALVESRRGKVELRVRIGNIGKGRVFIPFHFGYFDAKEGRGRAANELTQGTFCSQDTVPARR
jgi:ferredoxin-nitrate reductase